MITPSPVTLRRIGALLTAHANMIRDAGLAGFGVAVKDAAEKARRAFFSLDKYYLYEKDLQAAPREWSAPLQIDGVNLEIVFIPINLEEYELLGEKGYDFRKHPDAMHATDASARGTFVFLGVKDGTIIYRGCVSNFRNGVYNYVYPAANDSPAVCYQGFNYTHPAFRKRGLYTWAQTVMFEFMKNRGFKKMVMLEPENQVGPRRTQDRLGSTLLCASYAFRLLCILNYRWNERFLPDRVSTRAQ